MELSGIKDKYRELQDKYSMPGFDELDTEFEIRDITNENTILKEIKERILDNFDDYVKVLEGIVQPDTNVMNMYESRVFSDDEKIEVFRLYKRFIHLDRFALQTKIEDGEAKMAEFINTAYKEWMSMKQQILDIINRLKDEWTKEDDTKTDLGYLG